MKFLTITTALILLVTTLPTSAQVQYMTPWWTATGTSSDTCALGVSVAGIGDINSDGYDDFAVGTQENRVWIFLGDATPDSIPDLYINNPDMTGFSFGKKIKNIGDINSDSYDDIAVRAKAPSYPYLLKYYIYFAGANFDPIPDLVIGPPEIERPYKAIGIGDFNGDGGNDFALVDQGYQPIPGVGYYGRLQIYYGGEVLDSLPDWEITADSNRTSFPDVCIGLGDLNGDGCDELAASSPDCDGPHGENNTGLVEIYYGGSPPDTLPDFRFYGSTALEGLGSHSTALDVNGDGFLEMCLFSGRDFPPDYTSSVLIYNMVPQPDSIPDYFIGGNGFSLGGSPTIIDFNGDGWDDLATGNAFVHVYLGGEEFNESIDCIINGLWFDTYLGVGLDNIGDFNADGIDDLGAGEPGFLTFLNWPEWGRVHVLLGDTSYHQSVGIEPLPSPDQPKDFFITITAFPNPFNEEVKLKYTLNVPRDQTGTLQIYTIRGEVVKEEILPSGEGEVVWNAKGFPSGIYLIQLKAGGEQQVRKGVLLK